ncbi:MGMT family protein [Ornithinimicrobium sp. W1679]|jgi:alkylated DNA nucleotide flippase Atl1|uniref:MGMT family protein n=1 Tax=unclassified Ornithinimicrobium TaxID=2615080 RepID=UPI003CEC4FF2
MDDLLVERVLRAVEAVPPGRVVSYGDLASLVGTGPRHVGAVMARWGSGVPWWRVTDRSGRLRPDLLARAREQWLQEGIGLSTDGRGVRFEAHRADLDRLAQDHARATADLDDAAG